jgi:tetratricopeptide (TPR) repeat protein
MAWATLIPAWRNRAALELRVRAASALALGKPAEVEADARSVMAAYARVGPAGEPYLSAWQYLAGALANLGRHDEAVKELTDCHGAVLPVRGGRNAVVVGLRVNRASQLACLARYDEAETDCRAAIKGSRHVWPDATADRLRFSAAGHLVVVLNGLGLYAEAEALARPSLREAETSVMQADVLVLLRRGLAESINAQQRYAEAEQALRGLQPQEPVAMVGVRIQQAAAQLGLGKLTEAEITASEAVAEGTRGLSPVHCLTLTAGTVLGSAIARQGRREEAERELRTNVAAWAGHFGDEHPRTVTARAELAKINRTAGEAP